MTNRTKIIIGISSALVIGLSIFLIAKYSKGSTNRKSKSKVNPINPEVEDKELSDKFNFHLIPDGKNNYRSAQFTKEELPYVIKKYGIKNIIRLNGDGTDSQHKSSYGQTPKSEEEKICNELGCKFHFINAHSSYKSGEGYIGSINQVIPILNEGNTLIHCAHGADRTGYLVASYLQKENIITNKDDLWAYTTQYNGWQNMMNKDRFFGSGYDKYADGFYPINELSKSKWLK
jgi:hypothetical protein